MLVTKYAAELCALLVSDLFGELPSRILATLLTRGRSTILQLAQNTSLSLRYIRNGLCVLIQQSLLYHSTDPETGITSYEANCDACYALVRSGKILEVVDCRYGTAGRDLTQTLMLLGYARIADLAHAFGSRGPKINGSANGTAEYGTGLIESEDHFHLVLARLIQDDIVEAVRPDSFRNSAEVYRQIESEMTNLAPGEKTTKLRPEQSTMIAEKFKTFRDQGKALKRQVAPSSVPINKKRKLANGQACVDYVATNNPAPLNPSAVVRVNHEKCLVLLRNQRLEEFAAETFSPITGQVYRVLLDILTAQLARCRPDPFLGDEANGPSPSVTSVEIYNQLDEGMILHNGIGKVPKDMTDFHCAERIKPTPLDYSSDSDDSDDAAPGTAQRITTQVTEGDSVPGNTRKERKYPISRTTGGLQVKVKFEDEAASIDSRIDQMRQHLLLLAESKYRFLRHCGTRGRGQWTVDFGHVMECLREFEIDAYIEQSFGRQGLRLTRILREKGKLDEKMLPSAALMKKSDVQGKMLAMQMAGLVDVQEVPKDNSRLANRTLFFWFFDVERIQSQLLDDVYKVMLRCQQTLQAERNKERNILAFVERKDVEGREKDVMTTEHYNKYVCYLERQDKLLGQMMRLDDMVAVLRDY